MGIGVYDALAGELTDSDTGEVYPPLSCCNNEDFEKRCLYKNAPKVIWAISASQKFNSDCAVLLREGFKNERIRLLQSEYDAEESFKENKAFQALTPSDRVQTLLPYINTTLLVNELINLQHDESGGLIKLYEKSGMRKDRYSSLSYNYYVSTQIEKEKRKKVNNAGTTEEERFLFRAPKIL